MFASFGMSSSGDFVDMLCFWMYVWGGKEPRDLMSMYDHVF